MIEKLHHALFIDDDILFFDESSGNVTFSSNEMGMPFKKVIRKELMPVAWHPTRWWG